MARPITHGMSATPTWHCWSGMRMRCSNPKMQRAASYIGKGIKVCKRWDSFENFFEDMGIRPKGMTLERLNRNGNYTPSNCVWATPRAQALNRDSTVMISFDGKKKCLTDWANEIGIHRFALSIRIKRWGLKKALTTPRRVYYGRWKKKTKS